MAERATGNVPAACVPVRDTGPEAAATCAPPPPARRPAESRLASSSTGWRTPRPAVAGGANGPAARAVRTNASAGDPIPRSVRGREAGRTPQKQPAVPDPVPYEDG